MAYIDALMSDENFKIDNSSVAAGDRQGWAKIRRDENTSASARSPMSPLDTQ